MLLLGGAGIRGSGTALRAMNGMKNTFVMNMMAVNQAACKGSQQHVDPQRTSFVSLTVSSRQDVVLLQQVQVGEDKSCCILAGLCI